MVDVYIGLGSNLGDRLDFLRRALRYLDNAFRLEQVSSVYETEPVGYPHQGWFLNLAAHIRTAQPPLQCAAYLFAAELALRRDGSIPQGPRTIDLDLLFYAEERVDEPGLIIPHPRLHQRRFVLEPLNELCPDLVHPVQGRTVRALLSSLEDGHEVRKTQFDLSLPRVAGPAQTS